MINLPYCRSAVGPLAYGIAATAGLALVLWIFPLAFLFPDGQGALSGDVAQHAAGQRYFIHEPWSWPPLWIHNVIPPGVPLGFMDAIPLLAVPLKLARSLLPPGFHGIGLWYGIAWCLQSVAAVFCIRSAGERRLLPCLAFAAIAVSMPVWWARYGHAALTGHFILLLALGLYFRLLAPRPIGAWVAAGLLVLAAFLVHPYLAVMTMALVFAAPVTLAFRAWAESRAQASGRTEAETRSIWRPTLRSALWAAVVLAATFLLLRLLGYTKSHNPGGYGTYALNLLSPIWPFWSGLLPNPPSFAEVPSQTVGWEGYNWLGLGVLLALVLGIAAHPRTVPPTIRRHLGLVLALLALTAIAVSTRISFGGLVLIDLGSPPGVIQQFRASGRMFWPVAYTLALAGTLMIARLRPAALYAAALITLPALQWLDSAPVRDRLAQDVRVRQPISPEARALRDILPTLSAVTILPSWYCWTPEATRIADPILLQMLGLASERALPINTAYLARQPRAIPCSDDIPVAKSPLRPGEVRVFLTPGDGEWTQLRPEGPQECRKVAHALFCRLPGEPLPQERSPSLVEGLDFRATGNAISEMVEGWRTPGDGWTWSGGQDATLLLPRGAEATGPLRLTFEAIGFAPRGQTVQNVTVRVQGVEAAKWALPHMAFTTPTLEVPAGREPLQIDFHFERPASPAEIGMSADARLLAMGLRTLWTERR
jgi:hypothetical protein